MRYSWILLAFLIATAFAQRGGDETTTSSEETTTTDETTDTTTEETTDTTTDNTTTTNDTDTTTTTTLYLYSDCEGMNANGDACEAVDSDWCCYYYAYDNILDTTQRIEEYYCDYNPDKLSVVDVDYSYTEAE